MRVGGLVVGGSSYREAGEILVKATRPSAAQVANPCRGLCGGIIGGVDIYQGVVGDVGGSWYGGRWHDDGNVVVYEGDPHCSIAVVAVHLGVLPYPVPAASGRNGNTCGSAKTPTTAPKPPHTTRPNPWGRGRDMSASAPCSLNALDTQPWSAYQGAGGDGGQGLRGGGGSSGQHSVSLWLLHPQGCC